MKSSAYKKTAQALVALLITVYVTLLLQAHYYYISRATSLVIGLIIFLITFLFLGYAIKKLNYKLLNTPMLLLSLVIAGLVMAASPKNVNPAIEPDAVAIIKVTALGIKNDSSHDKEVWISNIYNNEQDFNLHTIPLPKGWEEKYNQLLSYHDQPSTLEIRIENPGKLQINFTRHSWSGKIKIEDGNKTSIIDLYKPDPIASYKYISTSSLTSVKHYNNFQKTGLTAIAFLSLSIFGYLFLLFARQKNNYFLLTIPLSLYTFFIADYLPLSYWGSLVPVALCTGIYFMMQKSGVNDFINSFTKVEKAFFLLFVIYAGFAFIGDKLFLANYPVKHLLNKAAYFFIFCSWLIFMGIAFMYLTNLCKKSVSKTPVSTSEHSPVKLYFTFFGIMVACWMIFFIAYFPATMSADSFDQWAQATGYIQLNNWHPVFHTLFNKLFLTIYKSPASIAMGQTLFMAAISANFFLFLYQKGLPLKWVLWATLIFALVPCNGIMSVTLWKDIPFTFSMVWLTLVFAKIVTNQSYFKKIAAYPEVILALVTAALFRHNGMLVYGLSIAALLVFFLKTRKPGLIICAAISAGLIFSYNLYISNPQRVIPTPPSVKLVAPIHGIAAVRFYGGRLDEKTTQEMEKILPDSIWLSHYRPFSADEYLFFTNRPFVENLAKLPTPEALQLYKNTLLKNPYLVIRDRLTGTEILWNVFEANGSFNFRYHPTLDENPFGIKTHDNTLKKIINKLLEISANNADPFLWRAGIYNILLLFLLLIFVKQSKWYLLIFIPVIGGNLSLLLSMTLQNFRYIYYVPLIFGFLWLLSLTDIISAGTIKKHPVKAEL